MKKNSFRCFAIFKSGVGDDIGSFLLVHKRGCKKTFINTEKKFRTLLTERNYEANKNFNPNNFTYDNWYAIKDEQHSKEGIWFALLCFQGCNPEKVYKALFQLQAYYLKIKDYHTLSSVTLKQKYDVDVIVSDVEEKIYGKTDDGYITEEEIIQPNKSPEKKQVDLSKVDKDLQIKNQIWSQAISNTNQQVIKNPKNQSINIQSASKQDNQKSTNQREENKIHAVQQLEVQKKSLIKRNKSEFQSQDATSQMQNISNQKTSDGYILTLIIITFLGAALTGAYVFFAQP